SFESSPLFAEWRQLHEIHGTNSESMPALFKAIEALKDPFRRRAYQAALIAEWSEVDAAGGLRFFLGKGRNASQRRQYLEEWLARDARAAVNALTTSDREWAEVARECLPEIARRTPADLARVVNRLPKPNDFWDTNVRDAFATAAQADLASARVTAEAITGPNRDQALAGIARIWATRDLQGAVDWAKGLPDGTDHNEI